MTLRARLALWTFASALVLAGALTTLLAQYAESTRVAQLRAEGRRIALSAVTLYDVLRLTGSEADKATLQSFLGAAVRGTGPADALAWAVVVDGEGRLVAGDVGLAGVKPEGIVALQSRLPLDVVAIDAAVVARDVAGQAPDAAAGRVLVGVSKARAREALLSTVALSGLASFGLASAVALLLFSVVTRRLVRPLAAVAEGMDAVKAGKREQLAPLPGRGDEAAALVDGFNDMIGALVDGERSHSALQRHVGKRAVRDIVGGAVGTGKRARVTALFFDVEGFGARMGRDKPEDVVALLQDIVKIVIEVVHAHNGHVEKLMGDALLAVWGLGGDDEPKSAHETRAVSAAIEIVDRCKALSVARRARNQEAFSVGVGVASGDAVIATVGTEDRAETVVVGEPVILARRIEEEAKAMGFGVLVAEETFRALATSFEGAATPPVLVRGIGVPLTLYRVRHRKVVEARA